MTDDLPPFLQNLLASPPPAGQGVHNWLYRIARQLHPHMPEAEIVNLLQTRVANCGRRVPRSEILDAVRNSRGLRRGRPERMHLDPKRLGHGRAETFSESKSSPPRASD